MRNMHILPYPEDVKNNPTYQQYYVGLLSPEENILSVLRDQKKELKRMIRMSPDPDYRYAENKWTIRQSLIHMLDTERVFAYRALCIARGDQEALSNMDHNTYADNDFSHLDLKAIWRTFKAVRKLTIQQVKNLTPEWSQRRGKVSNHIVSVNTLYYLIAGHHRHHMTLFKEKYGLDFHG